MRGPVDAGVGAAAFLDSLDADHNGVADLGHLGQFRAEFNASAFT